MSKNSDKFALFQNTVDDYLNCQFGNSTSSINKSIYNRVTNQKCYLPKSQTVPPEAVLSDGNTF